MSEIASDPPVAAVKAELFKAMAHPARIRALEVLAGGEQSVGELANLVGLEISALSQQLAVLRRAGVVATRREGNTVHYSLRDQKIAQMLALARQMIVANLQQSRAMLDTLTGPQAGS